MLDIYVPTIDGHNGCCFREILKIWEQNSWVKLHPIEKEEFKEFMVSHNSKLMQESLETLI